jgi:hypothetical protein
MGSLVAELAEKLSSATNSIDFDEQTLFLNTSANTVGVGTNAPASKFDVRGTMQVGVDDTGYDVKFFGDTASSYLEWDTSAMELEIRGPVATAGKLLLSTAEPSVVDGNKLGQIDFQAPVDTAGTDAILVGASIWAEADATFSSSVNSTELVFATGASETAAEKMRITSDGKVGIGTSAPDGTVHIFTASAGTVAASSQADDLVVENSVETGITIISPDAQSARIRFTSPSTNTDVGGGSILYRQNINKLVVATQVSGGIVSINSGADVPALYCQADANVDIVNTLVLGSSAASKIVRKIEASYGGGIMWEAYREYDGAMSGFENGDNYGLFSITMDDNYSNAIVKVMTAGAVNNNSPGHADYRIFSINVSAGTATSSTWVQSTGGRMQTNITTTSAPTNGIRVIAAGTTTSGNWYGHSHIQVFGGGKDGGGGRGLTLAIL